MCNGKKAEANENISYLILVSKAYQKKEEARLDQSKIQDILHLDILATEISREKPAFS